MDSALYAHISNGEHAEVEAEAVARVESSAALDHLQTLVGVFDLFVMSPFF
jgi:hypothetical protein